MEQVYEWLKSNLAEKGYEPERILDIGAWNGFWTKNCKTFWPNAHYTCIEAGPKHEKNLKEIADTYHIAVLGDENKQVEMYIQPVGYTKGATVLPKKTNYKMKPDLRQMQTLATVVGHDAEFDFIKQDIQAAEILCMKGSPDIFQRAKFVLNEVNLEYHDFAPDHPYVETMDEYMKNLGFEFAKTIAGPFGNPKQVDRLYCKTKID